MSPIRPSIVGEQSRLLVLGFHNIESTWCWPANRGVGLRSFTRQLQILSRCATVVDLREALDTLAAGGRLPPRAVALTFDDGYRDNLTLAAPLLRRHQMPATIFLVPGLLDRTVYAWWERLGWAVSRATARTVTHDGVEYPLATSEDRDIAQRTIENDVKSLTHAARAELVEDLVDRLAPLGTFDADELFLDWDSACALPAAGLSVGSHTLEHPILARESAHDQRYSLRESKRLLEDKIGVDASVLAYPNGTPDDYDATTLAEVQGAGYSYAVTTWGGAVVGDTPPFEIGRSLVGPYQHPARFGAFLAKRLVRG